jgi:hypothetical protein
VDEGATVIKNNFAALAVSSEPRFARDAPRLQLQVTGIIETSLPVGIGPTSLLETGTGSLTVAESPGDLVRSANDYVRALAVIPIDPAHDALVDRLVAERVVGTAKKRSLLRR